MTEMQMLEIPQDVLDSTRLTLSELKVELAVTLMPKESSLSVRRESWLRSPYGSFAKYWLLGRYLLIMMSMTWKKIFLVYGT